MYLPILNATGEGKKNLWDITIYRSEKHDEYKDHREIQSLIGITPFIVLFL